jgi:kumamolisin
MNAKRYVVAVTAAFIGMSLLPSGTAARTTPLEVAVRAAALRDLAGDVVHPRGVRDLGHLQPGTPVRVAFLMRAQHEAELRELVALQSTRSSRVYKRYLTAQQYRSYFAPSVQTYEHTLHLLAIRGFRVTQTFANRGLIRAIVPSAVAERYFATRIDRVVQADGKIRYMNVLPITVPAEISAVATAVSGLHSVELARYPHHVLAARVTRATATASPRPISTSTPGPNPSPDPTIIPDNGESDFETYQALGPGVFASAYDYPVMHGYGGSGYAAASIITADYANSDALAEFKLFGIPRTDTGTRVFVGAPFTSTDSDAELEATLDAEVIMSLAPKAAFYEYLTQNFDDEGLTAAYEQIVSDDLVSAVNSSFFLCETDDPGFEYQSDYLAMEGASEGITFSAATGDTGSLDCGIYSGNGQPQTLTGVSIPSAGYYFTAVGGTDYLWTPFDGAAYPQLGEAAWAFTGGGVSDVEPLPAWQQNTSGIVTTGRNTPDLAFVANPDPPSSALIIYAMGEAEAAGGTSLSSPMFVGMQTTINQVEGTRNGWVNPRLYAIQNAQGYYAFRDITAGTNVGYAAATGYDNTSGIGSPKGFELAGEE